MTDCSTSVWRRPEVFSTRRMPLLAALCLGLAGLMLASAQAQTSLKDLDTELLIGDDVSLSNRSYPEVDNAIQRFKNNDLQGARLFLDKAKEKHPQLPPPDLMMAKMQTTVRNAMAVRILLESAIKNYPDDPEAYLILADQAFRAGRTAEADALFEKADTLIQKYEGNAKRKRKFVINALAGRSAILERREQWDQAIVLLKKWIENDEDNAVARQRIGIALFRLDKSADAFKEFSKARELNPESPHPYVLIGRLYAQEGDDDKARTAFEKAYAEEKTDSGTARAYADWLIQVDELDKAQEVASALLQQDPEAIEPLFLDGVIAQMNGQSELAEKNMMKVLSIDPSNATATNLLAMLLIERDDQASKDRALSYAKLNAERFPNNGQAIITYAWVLYKLGHMREADAALKKGIQAGNTTPDSTYFIAQILSEQNHKQAAIQTLEQAVNQKSMFVYRKQAEQLLAKLKAELK